MFHLMPFGLRNPPAPFLRLMEALISGEISEIIVHSLEHLQLFAAIPEDLLKTVEKPYIL